MPPASTTWQRVYLAAAACMMAVVWLCLLPALAKTDSASSYLHWLEIKRIDPSVMFYSELECVDGLLESRRPVLLSTQNDASREPEPQR